MSAPRGQPAVDSATLAKAIDRLRQAATRERRAQRERSGLDKRALRLAAQLEQLADDLSGGER